MPTPAKWRENWTTCTIALLATLQLLLTMAIIGPETTSLLFDFYRSMSFAGFYCSVFFMITWISMYFACECTSRIHLCESSFSFLFSPSLMLFNFTMLPSSRRRGEFSLHYCSLGFTLLQRTVSEQSIYLFIWISSMLFWHGAEFLRQQQFSNLCSENGVY